jgi:predicted DNA-binding transcriptional regulator YafY
MSIYALWFLGIQSSVMDKLTRLFKLHQVLQAHKRAVPMRAIQNSLECSRATAARAIQEMRDYFGAPIEYDRATNGYLYSGEHAFQLPGLWFSESELLALLTFEQLLSVIGPGLLGDQLAPFSAKIREILASQGIGTDHKGKRVTLAASNSRPFSQTHFAAVADATLRRKQISLTYENRGNGEINARTLSPQRLTRYRDNWYLEAWCHVRNDLRTFSLDRILSLRIVEQPAKEVAEEVLARRSAASYGIYSGEPKAWAVLRFSTWQSRWVVGEQWHPDQKAQLLGDGRYELEVPYSEIGEIIREILGHGQHIEVVSPPELRQEVIRRLSEAVSVYQDLSHLRP